MSASAVGRKAQKGPDPRAARGNGFIFALPRTASTMESLEGLVGRSCDWRPRGGGEDATEESWSTLLRDGCASGCAQADHQRGWMESELMHTTMLIFAR